MALVLGIRPRKTVNLRDSIVHLRDGDMDIGAKKKCDGIPFEGSAAYGETSYGSPIVASSAAWAYRKLTGIR